MKLPGLICDLNQVDTNAADMVARANGTPIRLASKSIHIPELLRYVLDKPGFSGILAYSLAEAIDLVRDGISDDILVAYPSTDRAAFAALAADDTLRRAITIMIDSPDHLGFLPTKTTSSDPFRICLDVDASWKPLPGIHIGTRRSPIYRPRHAAHIAKQVRARLDTELVGIMMYEGHIAGVPDTSWAIRLMKRRARRALAGRRARVVQAVSAGSQLDSSMAVEPVRWNPRARKRWSRKLVPGRASSCLHFSKTTTACATRLPGPHCGSSFPWCAHLRKISSLLLAVGASPRGRPTRIACRCLPTACATSALKAPERSKPR
ncbi:alanine racemase [Corynebacterium propinquum]|uniref:alanine racemase n=1 Tax=Corynebacterium propinquum TaxID=43769 RepID=UPI001C930578|nr:alanine racemase [Corynebacterium propinquum]